MSLWSSILGARRPSVLPDALDSLELDLARLKEVILSAGDIGLALKLLLSGSDSTNQLRQINRLLGKQLATASARDRRGRAHAFAAGDAVLPVGVKAPVVIPAEASTVLATGCASLGRTMTDPEVGAIHAHLRNKPVLLAHVPGPATEQVASIDLVPPDRNYACYNSLDLWSSPGLIEFATQDRFIDLAQAYLGCTPTMYSLNAFWSFPNREPHKASQVFHRDWEDYRSLVIFTQLTPVDLPEDGAHYYVETSHDVAKFEQTLRGQEIAPADIEALSVRDETVIAPLAMTLFKNTSRRFDGPAGQSFCTDGYGLHRAEVPRTRPRLLLWIRFGNFFNDTAYALEPGSPHADAAANILERIPATPRHRYVFRYLIQSMKSH